MKTVLTGISAAMLIYTMPCSSEPPRWQGEGRPWEAYQICILNYVSTAQTETAARLLRRACRDLTLTPDKVEQDLTQIIEQLPSTQNYPEWSEIRESKSFQELNDDHKEEVRQAYFKRFLVPEIPERGIGLYRKAWDRISGGDEYEGEK